MKKRIFLLAMLAMVFAMFVSPVCAEDFDVAFTKTVSEIPDGADAAALGGATVAVPNFSSKNPAIIAVEPESKEELFQNSIYANYGYIHFEKGPDVNLGFASVTKKLPKGVLQIMGSYAASNSGEMDEFNDIKINNSPFIGIQYGLPMAKNLYAGISYTYSESKITNRTTIIDPMDMEIVSKSNGHEVGTGVLYRLYDKKDKEINVGIFYAHSWDEDKIFVDNSYDSTERSGTDQVRLGISAKITSLTMISAEVRQYWFPNGVNNAQFFAGIEQYVIKEFLAVYGGYANGGATIGLGIYFKHGGLNLAYMYRPCQSTEKWLGEANIGMLSVYQEF